MRFAVRSNAIPAMKLSPIPSLHLANYRSACAAEPRGTGTVPPRSGMASGWSGERIVVGLLRFAGFAGLAFCLFAASRMLLARRAAFHTLPTAQADSDNSINSNESKTYAGTTAAGTGQAAVAVIGRVEIPAIGLVTPLLAGDDSMSLTEGAGHIPGTAVPGGLGTVGIAGHRDTHFRKLSQVKPGMNVRLIDRTGTYHYRVTASEIVAPEQVSVLDIQNVPGLVLITCYPFSYIGRAPKRFVVHATLLSVAPDAPPGESERKSQPGQ
jgi:sortase A